MRRLLRSLGLDKTPPNPEDLDYYRCERCLRLRNVTYFKKYKGACQHCGSRETIDPVRVYWWERVMLFLGII